MDGTPAARKAGGAQGGGGGGGDAGGEAVGGEAGGGEAGGETMGCRTTGAADTAGGLEGPPALLRTICSRSSLVRLHSLAMACTSPPMSLTDTIWSPERNTRSGEPLLLHCLFQASAALPVWMESIRSTESPLADMLRPRSAACATRRVSPKMKASTAASSKSSCDGAACRGGLGGKTRLGGVFGAGVCGAERGSCGGAFLGEPKPKASARQSGAAADAAGSCCAADGKGKGGTSGNLGVSPGGPEINESARDSFSPAGVAGGSPPNSLPFGVTMPEEPPLKARSRSGVRPPRAEGVGTAEEPLGVAQVEGVTEPCRWASLPLPVMCTSWSESVIRS
mmetsp:Transcript_22713/g.40571  ORF Transcript_22713/g.40571 Transcript_22713/m.40571 type:complete len:337 (-) Transcript_22713:543-1553(-)